MKRHRGQVFILATLLIVVYAISIISMISEFSIQRENRRNDDHLLISNLLSEFIQEMDYQLQIALFNLSNTGRSTNLNELQNFQRLFENYAGSKGISSTFTLIPNSYKPSPSSSPAVAFSQNLHFVNISVQTIIEAHTSTGLAEFTGTIFHFFGYEILVSESLLTIRQVDNQGDTLKFISNINNVFHNSNSITEGVDYFNYNNGTLNFSPVSLDLIGDTLNFTLNNGINFFSN